ncbi:MAG TPA: sigma-70 family RNA polymerase sigma factor [Polyangiaceae bacterium]|nr:sigma-70 family RNA polymerase sigma factor [Polyangiaceae bacterium]
MQEQEHASALPLEDRASGIERHERSDLDGQRRLRAIVLAEVAFVGRVLRRLGVPDADVDDAAQEVFVALSRKLAAVAPGKERAFLFGACSYQARHMGRTRLRHERRVSKTAELERVAEPNPEQILRLRQARRLLDEAMDRMSHQGREVFVLHELEEMSLAEVATLLVIPLGTAKSRLRAAREALERHLEQHRSNNTEGSSHE